MLSRLFKRVGLGIVIAAMFCVFASAVETAKVSANGGLNFRVAADANSQIICTIPNGTNLTVIQRADTWTKINYANRDGYVMTKYIVFTTPVYSNTGTVVVSAANIRSAASETSACVTTVSKGAQVTIVSYNNGWYSIKYGNTAGFIRGDLITVNLANGSPAVSAASSKRTELIKYAATFLGTPYRSGGASPKGFDCSGYTQYVFSKFGYSIPRGPSSQYNALGTSISKSELKPGDLVFFKNPYNGRSVGHVGIYVGNGQMIHSNQPGGSVRYVTINSGYYSRNYVGARRVIFD